MSRDRPTEAQLVFIVGQQKFVHREDVVRLLIRLAVYRLGSDRELYGRLGVTRGTLQGWKRGTSRPRRRHLDRLAEEAGVEPGSVVI